MKNTFYIFTFLLFLCSISACKKEATTPSFTDTPVVQSYLQVGSPASVNVSRLIPYDANAQFSADNLDSLHIHILSSGITHALTAMGGGNYVDSSLIITDTATYTLQFTYNGKMVSATTKALSKPVSFTQSAANINITQIPLGGSSFSTGGTAPDPITLNWSNPDNSYYIVLVENTLTNPELVNLNDAGEPPRLFRSEPTQNNTSQINPRSFKYYGTYKITLYHVLPEYADLYKNSGTSSLNLLTPSTNITNGLGIFTAINSAVLYVDVHKI